MPSYSFKEFMEHSQHVSRDLPHLRGDIMCRIELLTAKWESLQMETRSKDQYKKRNCLEVRGKQWQ